MYDQIAANGVVVVGAGVAGLVTALCLAPRPVTVVTAGRLNGDCASRWSQGGIAAAVGPNDDPDQHATDTIHVAGGIADHTVVSSICGDGPNAIAMLAGWGVRFDHNRDGTYRLSREGGHSRHRVLRCAGDSFGRELMRALMDRVRTTKSITVIENHVVTDIHNHDDRPGAEVAGITMMRLPDKRAIYVPIDTVVLATGGAGALYAVTTNPGCAIAHGVAMAARCGARISDFEFVQFHPTAIDVGADPAPLATEALRGEGAVLVNGDGVRFMADWHKLADLAPRDVVAKAIHDQIARGQRVFLDARDAIGQDFPQEFPAVFSACTTWGIDPRTELIPIVPAAHYHMGGVAVDYRTGQSDVQGLYVLGESAATGLHGANRLASNSLLEGVVMARRAASHIAASLPGPAARGRRSLHELGVRSAQENPALVTRLRTTMQRHLGLIRDESGLQQAIKHLSEIESVARTTRLRDMALAGRMIATSALLRRESRGGHFRADYPEQDPSQAARSYITLAQANQLLDGDTPQNRRQCA